MPVFFLKLVSFAGLFFPKEKSKALARKMCKCTVRFGHTVTIFLLLECCEKRQEEKEEQCVEHAHEALEQGEIPGYYLVPGEIERLKTHESQRSRDKSQEYTCEVVSSHISPKSDKVSLRKPTLF